MKSKYGIKLSSSPRKNTYAIKMTIESAANSQSPLRVAVLAGGIGQERDISIQSGDCVAKALKQAGLDVITADIGPDNLSILDEADIEVFFIALHGKFGEDGQLQQILEDNSLIYTGSGPAASKMAFDKMAGKKAFLKAGLKTPAAIEFTDRTEAENCRSCFLNCPGSFVVKPTRQGSTIGVTIVDSVQSALEAAPKCLEEFGDCMIEQFIEGREITVGILGDKVLPIIEIKSSTGFYDYHAKYVDEQTEFLFDTIDEPALIAKINAAAMDCFSVLGCRDFGRVDFILGNDGTAYILELNTIPGLTSHSLVPKAAAKAGLSMSDLCVNVIEMAMQRQKTKCYKD